MAKAYSVPSAARAMKILELLAHSQRGLTLSDISRKLGLPKSSAHVLIKTLESAGYLRNSAISDKYFFGLKLVSLSKLALQNLDLREQGRPFLEQLARQTQLTVHLAILEGIESVIIEKIEAPGMLRLATWVGRRFDAHCSGFGKALLAFATPVDGQQQFLGQRLAKHNRNTISSPAMFVREMKKIREQGYAFEDEEGEIGFRCVGVPVYDSAHHAIAAISVAGTTSQIPKNRVANLAQTVKATAAQISSQLGCDIEI